MPRATPPPGYNNANLKGGLPVSAVTADTPVDQEAMSEILSIYSRRGYYVLITSITVKTQPLGDEAAAATRSSERSTPPGVGCQVSTGGGSRSSRRRHPRAQLAAGVPLDGGLWFAIIGVFIVWAARAEEQETGCGPTSPADGRGPRRGDGSIGLVSLDDVEELARAVELVPQPAD